MTLELEYIGNTTIPLELQGVTPCGLRELSLPEIEKFKVYHGKDVVPLAEFFKVSGDLVDEQMSFSGDLSGVHWIGWKMESGSIAITENCGRHLGSEMTAGTITVQGSASDWVGAEMRGGLIHIKGNAGHQVGASYRGSLIGMNRGTILVHGDVGNELGLTMRRGLIAVAGKAGDLIGFNMRAGTIMLFGETGIRHGAAMRRGSIVFMGAHHPPLLPSFKYSCRYQPEIMQLLLRNLKSLGFPIPNDAVDSTYDLYHGDMIDGGRGEVLLRMS